MASATTLASYKSHLFRMTQTTPTCLWNDSPDLDELAYSIEHGAVGATCNPCIVLAILKKRLPLWRDRIEALIQEMSTATEDQTTPTCLWNDSPDLDELAYSIEHGAVGATC